MILEHVNGVASCLLCGKSLSTGHACLGTPDVQTEDNHAYLEQLAASRTDYSVYAYLRIHGPEWLRRLPEADLNAHLRYCHIPPLSPYAEWQDVVSRVLYPVVGEPV